MGAIEVSVVTVIGLICGIIIGCIAYRKFASQTDNATTQQLKEMLEIQNADNRQLLQEKTAAITEKQELEKQRKDWVGERNELIKDREDALRIKTLAEKELALIQQDMHNKIAEIQNLEKHSKEITEAAKASVAEAGTLLSTKLLEDHKRETEAAKEESKKQVKETTDTMFNQMKEIITQVNSMKENHNVIHKQFNNFTRMLSTPHGAGNLSEVGLENALKSCDLIEGRDFCIQYTISGGESQGLRPDCVIFLPQNSVMVIDSKSSKLFGEFSEIDSPEKEKEMVEKLSASMNRHLRTLASKNYEDAIRKEYASAGRSGNISNIWNVMYMPNESIIEKILSVDVAFREKCLNENIIPAGPAGLYSLLLIAARQVELAKQSESHAKIMEAMNAVVDCFSTSIGHLTKFNKQFTTAANTFSAATKSINRNLLPKFSELAGYGLSSKRQGIPLKLPSFEIQSSDSSLMIDMNAEEDTEVEITSPPLALVKEE